MKNDSTFGMAFQFTLELSTFILIASVPWLNGSIAEISRFGGIRAYYVIASLMSFVTCVCSAVSLIEVARNKSDGKRENEWN